MSKGRHPLGQRSGLDLELPTCSMGCEWATGRCRAGPNPVQSRELLLTCIVPASPTAAWGVLVYIK